MEKRIARMMLKAAVLIPAAGMLMGNTSCSQKTGRELRRIVDLGRIQTPPMQIITGENFDFGYVVNQQVYAVFHDVDGFVLRYNPPLSTKDGETKLNLSSGDKVLFSKMMEGTAKDPFINWSKDASCFVFMPQLKIDGAITSFEAVGGGGLSIGYSPAGIQAPGLPQGTASFKLDYAQLSMSMTARHPITSTVLAAANIDAKRTKMNIGLNLSLGPFSVGPSAWYSTPLAKVTENALRLAISEVKEKIPEDEVWYTRVLAGHDTHVTIIGGTRSGLKKGDELAIYNETYYWTNGTPCAGQYTGGVAVDPVAVGVVVEVGDEITSVRITKQSDENPVVGAKVKLLKFVDPEAEKPQANTDGLRDVPPPPSPKS